MSYRINGTAVCIVAFVFAMNSAVTAQYSLTFLHNNDGESQLFSSGGIGGVAEFSSLLNDTRNFYQGAGHGVVAISSGDNFIPSPEFSASLESGAPGSRTFYDALALSRVGYDAVIIGNHEFDAGPQVLAEFIGDAQTTNPTTFLSANLDFSGDADLSPWVGRALAPSKVVTVSTAAGNKTVGIIGATTENLPFISSPGSVTVGDVATAVNAQVAALSGTVDHMVLASHLQGVDEDQMLVPMLTGGIDLIIAGGGDDRLATAGTPSPTAVYGASAPPSVVDTGFAPGDAGEATYPIMSASADLSGNTIPIVSTDANYKYLGRVTLGFDAGGNFMGVESSSNPQLVQRSTADAGIAADIGPVATFVANLDSQIIGMTSQSLMQSSDLVRSAERAIGNLVADGILSKARELSGGMGIPSVDIAIANGGGIRSPIDAGDISLRDTFDVSPFGNVVSVIENVTAADLLMTLENAYSRTVDTDPLPGADNVNPARMGDGTGRFAQIAGFSVVYDISKQSLVLDDDGNVVTAGERVVDVTLDDGTVIIQDGIPVFVGTLNVATLDFLARGGDQYWDSDYLSQTYSFTNLGVTDQQALASFISSFGGADLAVVNGGAYDSNADGRITAIPEPSGLLILVVAAVASPVLVRRNRYRADQ